MKIKPKTNSSCKISRYKYSDSISFLFFQRQEFCGTKKQFPISKFYIDFESLSRRNLHRKVKKCKSWKQVQIFNIWDTGRQGVKYTNFYNSLHQLT